MVCGSQNQMSYSDVIHWGTVPSGTSPSYHIEKLCHATLPNGVKSIVLYKSRWFEKGGGLLCFRSVNAQRSSSLLIFGTDIWVWQYINCAVSNSIQSLYGVQSSGWRLVCHGGDGVFGGKLALSSLQGWPSMLHHQLEHRFTVSCKGDSLCAGGLLLISGLLLIDWLLLIDQLLLKNGSLNIGMSPWGTSSSEHGVCWEFHGEA